MRKLLKGLRDLAALAGGGKRLGSALRLLCITSFGLPALIVLVSNPG